MKSSFPALEKKVVPENKKYAHIGSSIDTGASAKKEKLHSANVTAKRKDEIFKRIRPITLVRLLQEREVSESVYALGPGCGDARFTDGASSVIASKGPVPVPPSMASVTSVALSKHVHRSDHREGMAKNGRTFTWRRKTKASPTPRHAVDNEADGALSPQTTSRRARCGQALPEWLQVARSPQRILRMEKKDACERWLKNVNRFVEKQSEDEVVASPRLAPLATTVPGRPWRRSKTASRGRSPGRYREGPPRTAPLPKVTFKGSDPLKEAWISWDFIQHMPEHIGYLLRQSSEEFTERAECSGGSQRQLL